MAVLTYKCPNCDAELTFRPESQAFVCDYCGSHFTPQEVEQMMPAEDTRKVDVPQKRRGSGFLSMPVLRRAADDHGNDRRHLLLLLP